MMKSQAELQRVISSTEDITSTSSSLPVDHRTIASSLARMKQVQVEEIVLYGFSREDALRMVENHPGKSTSILVNMLIDSNEQVYLLVGPVRHIDSS
jgi:hypothetical protein